MVPYVINIEGVGFSLETKVAKFTRLEIFPMERKSLLIFSYTSIFSDFFTLLLIDSPAK
jgi:hypothetical protein